MNKKVYYFLTNFELKFLKLNKKSFQITLICINTINFINKTKYLIHTFY